MSGDIGVVLSSCIILTGALQYGMRQSAEMENMMTSVERILEYSRLEAEEEDSAEKFNPPAEWPRCGAVEFRDVRLSYDRKPVLKGISLNIRAGEKVSGRNIIKIPPH